MDWSNEEALERLNLSEVQSELVELKLGMCATKHAAV